MIVTAVTILFRPDLWFFSFPGVAETGPFNAHLSRDVGAATLVAGIVIAESARRWTPPLGALLAATAFLAIHACVHLVEMLAMLGGGASAMLYRDLLPVYLPPIASALLSGAASKQSASARS